MLTSKIEYWQAKENTITQGWILTSKGKLTRSSKAATVTLAASVAFQSGGGTGFKQDRAKKQRKMRNAGQRGEIHPEGGNWRPEGEMQLHLTWGSGSYHLATTWWIMSNCNYRKNTKCGIEVEKSADHCTGGGLHAGPQTSLGWFNAQRI